MATATEAARDLAHVEEFTDSVLLHDISWAAYEFLCKDLEESHVRLTYDQGTLEIAMSPLPLHEQLRSRLGRFVEDVLVGLQIPSETGGQMTWKRIAVKRGLEADECYYIDPEKVTHLAGRLPDRNDDPLPDLAIELDTSSPKIDRPAVYAALGIPELWR